MIKLILILAFIICLSWLALGIGASRKDGSVDGAFGNVDSILGDALRANLRASDVRSTQTQCKISGAVITVPDRTTCTFKIAKGGFRVRTSAIEMQRGTGNMQFVPGKSDKPRPEPTQPVRLTQSKSKDISVYGEGGDLVLRCQSTDNEPHCQFRLKRANS
ncbi:hypothetical protein [Parasulfitobacter algicola]|uniref:Uncharacterized protein n=1 Tax=Parasulfitobacter algicola TaxID=2614809 RepID=A0ABX2IUR4_9RHOB|nr:hypothetical protein [Sulfitobacter algicola]NSX55751.1 hypothetical protein [Sulfitobacter algicola]